LSVLKVVCRVRDPRHAPDVRALLEGELDNDARLVGIRALGTFGDAASAEMLWQLLDDDNADVARAAQLGIGEIREPATLEQFFAREGGVTRNVAAAILRAGGNVDAPGPQVQELALQHVERGTSPAMRNALKVLGHGRRSDSIEPITKLYRKTPNESLKTAALDALISIQTQESIERGLEIVPLLRKAEARETYARKFQILQDRYRR